MCIYKNNQEVFNVIYHAVTNGMFTKRNVDNRGLVTYEHTPTGCFIGFLFTKHDAKELQRLSIANGAYSIQTILYNAESFLFFCEAFKNCTVSFLQELQLIHDGNSPSNWKSDLEKLAKKYDLTTSF